MNAKRDARITLACAAGYFPAPLVRRRTIIRQRDGGTHTLALARLVLRTQPVLVGFIRCSGRERQDGLLGPGSLDLAAAART